MDAVREYCDEAILIEKSELVARGSADKIAARYTQMFIEEASGSPEDQSKKTKRWGDKRITFTDVIVTPTRLTKNDQLLTVTTEVQSKEDMENPAIGFIIKNSAGQNIIGTNTKLQHVKLRDIGKGQKTRAHFTIPNVFADGHYVVDVAVVSENGSVCEWWEEAKTFSSYEENPTPYVVSPSIKAEAEEL
jgi:ABC-type glutathione transport system ATPase component